MKKRGLAILIAVLGVLCVVCGALLLQGNSAPVTAEPSPSSTVEATPSPAPAETPEPVSSQPETEEPYVSPIDFASLQAQNPDIYGWLRIPGTGNCSHALFSVCPQL